MAGARDDEAAVELRKFFDRLPHVRIFDSALFGGVARERVEDEASAAAKDFRFGAHGEQRADLASFAVLRGRSRSRDR